MVGQPDLEGFADLIEPRERAALVYDRLALLSPPPSASTRKRVLAQDHAALDAWWDSLGLGSSRLFRIWRGRPAI